MRAAQREVLLLLVALYYHLSAAFAGVWMCESLQFFRTAAFLIEKGVLSRELRIQKALRHVKEDYAEPVDR